MLDSSSSELRQFEGADARVTLTEDKAILTTQFGLPTEKARLKQKVGSLIKFKKLTSGVKNLHVPEVLEEDDLKGEYTLERAREYNLDPVAMQGNIFSFFRYERPSIKTLGIITYLRMVGKLNSQGYAFVDHKLDSVFIDKEKVTIVDTGAITEYANPWKVDTDINNGMLDVLEGFFTHGLVSRNLGIDPKLLIPAGIRTIIENLQKVTSATEAATRIEGFMNDTYDPSQDYVYVSHRGVEKKLLPQLPPYKLNPYEYDVEMSKSSMQKAFESEDFYYYARHLFNKGLLSKSQLELLKS